MGSYKIKMAAESVAIALIAIAAVCAFAWPGSVFATTEVVVQRGNFSQDPVTIKAGEEVVWITPHENFDHLWFIDYWRPPRRPPIVTYESGGKVVRVKFERAGTYRYLCRMDQGEAFGARRGAVIVK